MFMVRIRIFAAIRFPADIFPNAEIELVWDAVVIIRKRNPEILNICWLRRIRLT
jgi:hypothetical protein